MVYRNINENRICPLQSTPYIAKMGKIFSAGLVAIAQGVMALY